MAALGKFCETYENLSAMPFLMQSFENLSGFSLPCRWPLLIWYLARKKCGVNKCNDDRGRLRQGQKNVGIMFHSWVPPTALLHQFPCQCERESLKSPPQVHYQATTLHPAFLICSGPFTCYFSFNSGSVRQRLRIFRSCDVTHRLLQPNGC